MSRIKNTESTRARPHAGSRFRGMRLLMALGPGLITGAADDDPSGIATYSQVGAKFGYGMLWVMPFSYPLMAVIQEISARIGRVTGAGIAANIRRHYPKPILYGMVSLLLVANIFNLGADIGAMGAAAKLFLPGPVWAYILLLGATSLLLQIAVPYTKYVSYLKWLTLALFAYIAAAIVVGEPKWDAIRATFWPTVRWNSAYLTALTAVLGTTISPYLFFWQASVEVEEQRAAPREKPLKVAPDQAPAQLERMRSGTYLGMAFSNIIAFFIILDTGAVLHAHGITDIQTGAQAAEALRPLAGELAFLLFSIGIIGTGLIAVPVLAGSSAYGLAETLKWPIGLERKLHRAKGFYGILTVATIIGVALNFIGLNPIKALFWSAVINGVAAVPIMIVMMLMTSNKKITGGLRLPTAQRVIGWTATAVMFAVAASMLATILQIGDGYIFSTKQIIAAAV